MLCHTAVMEKHVYRILMTTAILISIFIIVAVITTLTIIFRILKIARTNPAEVIKNE